MSTREELVKWLLDKGYAEERSGYGHVDAVTLATALIAAGWVDVEQYDPEPPNPQNNTYSGDNVRDLQDMRDTGRPGL